jgi:hypothetical protein
MNPGCIINEGFSKGCTIGSLDFNGIGYSMGMYASWGLITFVVPWTIFFGIIALIALLVNIAKSISK